MFLASLVFSNITFSNNTTTLTLNSFFSFFINRFFVLVVVFITFLRYMFFVFFCVFLSHLLIVFLIVFFPFIDGSSSNTSINTVSIFDMITLLFQ